MYLPTYPTYNSIRITIKMCLSKLSFFNLKNPALKLKINFEKVIFGVESYEEQKKEKLS